MNCKIFDYDIDLNLSYLSYSPFFTPFQDIK